MVNVILVGNIHRNRPGWQPSADCSRTSEAEDEAEAEAEKALKPLPIFRG
jgi:hypothetical protein